VSHRGGGTDRSVGMGAVATGRLDAALVVGYISVSPHACTRSSCLAPSKFTSPVGVGRSAMGCISSGQHFASRSLPAILISRLWQLPERVRIGLAFCLTLICVLLPWSIRNRLEPHAVFPVRSNGWAEIYFGNVNFGIHPTRARPGYISRWEKFRSWSS
jgi:hypothetical protein